MPNPSASNAVDAARAHWTGLDPADLRALERKPLDLRVGFAMPERVSGTEEVPAVKVVLAILNELGADGVPVSFDGAFDAATTQAIGVRIGSQALGTSEEPRAPLVSTARRLAEAAGLVERRMGRVRVTAAGRRVAADDADALLPHLLRAWARRPLEASGRFAAAVHATWPLTVLLLRRFGERWLSAGFYATLIAELAPEAVASAPGADEEEARDAFFNVYVLDMLLSFAAFVGLVEFSTGDDPTEEPELRSTWVLDALLPLAVNQAPASDAIEDWDEPQDQPAADFDRELSAALAEHRFETKAELEAFVESFIAERNAAPVADFDGLPADAMRWLLQDPFGVNSPLVVADVPSEAPRSALLHLVLDLLEALGDAGVKATARGNLPRAYVLAALERHEAAGWGVEPYVNVRNEQDFVDLHLARLVARTAGLVTLRSGRWHATRAGRRTLERTGAAGVYAALFRAFVTKYAWNSADLYPQLGIVQASWAFSLLQLLRHGATTHDGVFYVERFLRAFPMAVVEAEDAVRYTSWQSDPRDAVQNAYELRVLERFAAFLGLAEVERGNWLEDRGRVLRVRATPALADVVAERTPRGGSGNG